MIEDWYKRSGRWSVQSSSSQTCRHSSKVKIMKFFPLLILAALAFVAFAEEQNKYDVKEVEKLLQEIEKEQSKLKPSAEDGTVSESLQKLFASLRQVTTSYVNVLNSINKSLGLPKYPKLGGRQSQSLPIRQIQENLSQIQEAASDVGQLIRRVVSGVSEDSRRTIVGQFRRFTDLWSKHLNEISRMFDNSIHGRKQVKDDANIFTQINRYLTQVTRDIQDFVNRLSDQIRNQLPSFVPGSRPN